MAVESIIASVAAAVQIVLAGALGVLAARAWKRVPGPRAGYLTLAMTAFLLEGIVLAWSMFTVALPLATAVAAGLVLNALALAALYAGVLRP